MLARQWISSARDGIIAKSNFRKYGRGGLHQHLFGHFCTSEHAGFLDKVPTRFVDNIV